MQTGDIGSMMNQYKDVANITSDGTTAADSEKTVTAEGAQETPAEKPQQAPEVENLVEGLKSQITGSPAPDSSNLQLKGDITLKTDSAETQGQLGQAFAAIDANIKSKIAVFSAKPVIKDAIKNANSN